jgi:hypothetical protein
MGYGWNVRLAKRLSFLSVFVRDLGGLVAVFTRFPFLGNSFD